MNQEKNEDLVVVTRPQDEVTANIIKIALEDAGMPTTVQAYNSSLFDGIFTPSVGAWGEVLVAPEDADRAKAVLKQYAEGTTDQTQEDS